MTGSTRWLDYRPPLAAGPLLAFLARRAVPGVEEVIGSTYRRSIPTPSGPAVVALTPRPERDRVHLHVRAGVGRAPADVVPVARSLLDLDADPVAIDRILGRDPLLRPLVRAHRGLRVPGAADGFELVVRAILGQQVSVRAARTMLARVVDRFGSPLRQTVGAVSAAFPSPARLAHAPLEELGITRRRAATLRTVAEMAASGRLELTGGADPDETTARLLSLDGIGPWTAAYVRMRALRDPDAFPSSDLGVRRSLERLGADPSPAAILDRAEGWRPWRAYAVMHLWGSEP